MRQEEGETILTTHTILCIVTFLKIQILNLHEHDTSIYSVRVLKIRWENSNETHLKLPQKTSHMEGVTSLGGVTWFLSLAPPKTTPTPFFYVIWKV